MVGMMGLQANPRAYFLVGVLLLILLLAAGGMAFFLVSQDVLQAEQAGPTPCNTPDPSSPLVPCGPACLPPGGQTPDISPLGDRPPGIPAGPPDVAGRIASITAETLELETPNGPRQVSLTPETRFTSENGTPLVWQDLRPGDHAGVFGLVEGAAILIVRLPPP